MLLTILLIYSIHLRAAALKTARQELKNEETALANTRLQLSRLLNIREQGANLQERLDRYVQMVPESPGEEEIIHRLQTEAAKSGLEFAHISFASRQSTGGYIEMPFNAEFQGNFNSFVQFLARLQKGPRIIQVKQCQVNTSAGSTAVSADILGSAFYSEQ